MTYRQLIQAVLWNEISLDSQVKVQIVKRGRHDIVTTSRSVPLSFVRQLNGDLGIEQRDLDAAKEEKA